MMRTRLLLLLIAAVAATLAGCDKQPPTGTSGTPATGGAAPVDENETVTNPTPVDKDTLTIGVTMPQDHLYWNNMIVGFEEEAAAQGEARGITVDVVILNCGEDPEKQITQCQNFAAQGVDAVAMVPVQREASAPALWVLNQANIPVILVNRTVEDPAERAEWVGYTGTDTYEGARVSAELLVEAMGGEGKIAELQQVIGSDPQLARSQALQDVLAENPGMELVAQQSYGNNMESIVGMCQDIIGANPEIAGIYAQGDIPALNALRAAEAADRSDIKIVGMGGQKEALPAIAEGRLAGTSYQQPNEEGRMGMRAAVAYLMGEPVKRHDRTPVLPITQENADEYEGQF